jgi:hypothetical protein
MGTCVIIFLTHASSSTSATNSTEVEEMKRKLARSKEDLNSMRQQADQAQCNGTLHFSLIYLPRTI